MADYDPMGLAVSKMDDDSPADMSTVFSDTDVTKASTSTMMVTVTATPVTTSGTIPSTSADGSRCTEGTAGSRIMSRLEGLQLNVDQFRIFYKHLTSWFNLQCVRNYMARDAIQCCLCKTGYAVHD